MNLLVLLYLCIAVTLVTGAAIQDDDVDQQGLYSKSDHVTILTNLNFDKKIYGKDHAWIVQFYNSYCGHCRSFMPKFKVVASDLIKWQTIIKIGVVDCSVEENNEICRQFEIMAYPSLRYFHENYRKANSNIGEKIQITDTSDKLVHLIIDKIQAEQAIGNLRNAPSLRIASYRSYADALNDVPSTDLYTFLVIENENMKYGSHLALDLNQYSNVKVKRVHDTSSLAEVAGVTSFPALIVVKPTLEATNITPRDISNDNMLNAVNKYLRSNNYAFPERTKQDESEHNDPNNANRRVPNDDIVYYSDLETTLQKSLHTEVTRYKELSGEALQALFAYLDVLITSFPFRGNLKNYIVALRAALATKDNWGGTELYETIKSLETTYAPVYLSNLEYIGCRGSNPKYRGYTCGLWTLFHTLTVNAAKNPGNEGPKVLRAMHGYVKHFFGCTTCQEHFLAMADRNRIFDVKENDKAVLWLWISHNEVNLRLAGDVTEDPEHPKIQFPSIAKCPQCRLARGAWNLPAVYEYLNGMYRAENIQDFRRARAAAAPSPFSNLDIGMLSLLYMY